MKMKNTGNAFLILNYITRNLFKCNFIRNTI